MTHVPYTGADAAMTDLIGGRIELIAQPVTVLLSQINSGALRPIGVSPKMRLSVMPDVPTVSEQGVRGFDIEIWVVLLAPDRVPENIVDRLNASILKVLAQSNVKRALGEQGFTEFQVPRPKMQEYLAQQAADWRKMVLDAGAQPE